MCSGLTGNAGWLYDKKTFVGKTNTYVDPMGAALGTGDAKKLDPLHLGGKDLGDPPPPKPPPQAAQSPDLAPVKKRNQPVMATAGPTLLTGPAGVDYAQLNLGSATLLGG